MNCGISASRVLHRIMNHYFPIIGLYTAAVLVIGATVSSTAHAAQEMVLTTDQSQLVRLPEAPTTIILGNPAVADVTTDGNVMFLHPRGYGLTNLIALDADGKKLADYVIRVIYEDAYSLSMYSPAGRKTYSCRKNCQTTLHVGDEESYFTQYNDQLQVRNGLATGQPIGPSRQSSAPTTGTGPTVILTPPVTP